MEKEMKFRFQKLSKMKGRVLEKMKEEVKIGF
jgi:hypothetical protein